MIDLFHDGSATLTERERTMMEDILHRLVREMESAVRRIVADRLANEAHAPRALVNALANDQIEVAWPILLRSRALEDTDLIEIIYHRSLEHKLAIAQRGALSEAVADALIRSGEERLIVTLLNNSNARLSRAAMEYLVEQAERTDSFQEPLVLRSELTDDLARRMLGVGIASRSPAQPVRYGFEDGRRSAGVCGGKYGGENRRSRERCHIGQRNDRSRYDGPGLGGSGFGGR